MRRVLVPMALCLLAAVPALAQATSEWHTSRDLPVAVIEVAGGDAEVIAAALPTGASPPEAVAGFSTTLTPEEGVLLWTVTVPALLAPEALAELGRTLATTGAAAVLLLGPTPARELREALTALETVPARPLPRLPCVLADGGMQTLRGAPESVALSLAMPGPGDPRYDLVPALVALLRIRLLAVFPSVRIDSELRGGCARLRLEVAAGNESARTVLRRLRRRLAEVAATPPTAEEVTRAVAASRDVAAHTAVSARATAEELAERLALGGGVAAALSPPALDAPALAELARALLAGRAGFATLVEQERRPESEPPETLDDGVVLSVRWVPSETAVVAVALGGVDPRTGRTLLAAAADRAARSGWNVAVGEILGVPTLAVAASGDAIVNAMESLSDAVTGQPPQAADDLGGDVARAEGLAEHASAEAISIALLLPPEFDEGPEAARKFFGGLASSGVRTGATPPGPGLAWTVKEGEPGVVGVVDVPTTTAGIVALQVIRDRLGAGSGLRTFLLAPPGRVVLAVAGEGGAHVPALDERLASLWKGARRACTPAELARATHGVLAELYGDPAQATARVAASAFLPQLPTVTALLATEASETNAALAAFPAWEQLPRLARGRAPQVVVPKHRTSGVRKSPPGR